MHAIETLALTKKYKDSLAVDELNLQIAPGELFALLGVNGAGKTTTVKMLSCLTTPTEGDALLLGKSIREDATAVKSVIAVSPQETAVAPGLTAAENLSLICGLHGFSKEKREAKMEELTRLLSLPTACPPCGGGCSPDRGGGSAPPFWPPAFPWKSREARR